MTLIRRLRGVNCVIAGELFQFQSPRSIVTNLTLVSCSFKSHRLAANTNYVVEILVDLRGKFSFFTSHLLEENCAIGSSGFGLKKKKLRTMSER